MIANLAEVNLEVFHRYAGISLPRHVSYPMPSWWRKIDPADAASMIDSSNRATPTRDLSLYVHIPFCEALCKFCACNRVIQRKGAADADRTTEAYVQAVRREITGLAEKVGDDRRLRQVHWGGGTPTYLSIDQVERLYEPIAESFTIDSDAEISLEIDPRVTSSEMLETLRRLGFNRVSMGVQDFDLKVQQHVRRVQSAELVQETTETCRDLGFESVNFDLIYGMPYQTPETIARTVAKVIELSPDRVAYYHYAQIPEKIATQRGMDYTKLPDSQTKLEMFLIGLELFESAGYEFVGLDHFARPDEELVAAREKGTLQRNFQGMTTGGGLDLLGVGVSSISTLSGIGFLQNVKETDRYISGVESGESVVERGKRLTRDDRIRQELISGLYCLAEIQPTLLEEQFDIVFDRYFERELKIVHQLERDGLIVIDGDGVIRVTLPLGRVLMRNVAAVFDAYLDPNSYRLGEKASFSINA